MDKPLFIEPHTQEWYTARLGILTSSEIIAIFKGGKRPMTKVELAARPKANKALGIVADTRKTVDTLFGAGAMSYINLKVAEVINQVAKEGPRGDAIDWGLSNEPYAVELYEKIKGVKTRLSGFYKKNDFFGGTPDREVGRWGILEVKCPWAPENHTEICTLKNAKALREYDEGYYAQCQSNMYLLSAKWCDFISFDPRPLKDGMRPEMEPFCIKIIRIKRDEEFIKELEYRIGEASVVMTHKLKLTIKNANKNRRAMERRIAA